MKIIKEIIKDNYVYQVREMSKKEFIKYRKKYGFNKIERIDKRIHGFEYLLKREQKNECKDR